MQIYLLAGFLCSMERFCLKMQSGSHEFLIKEQGIYYRMFYNQFKDLEGV
jgi:hypothetical protein